MNKRDFLEKLRKGLSGLPENDREEHLTFYGEMIDDRMEDGIPEETAVAEIGDTDELISRIFADTPLKKLVKERISPKKKPGVWEIVLLALGFPVWGSLLIAVLAVIFSLYVSLWAVIVSLWAADAAAVCGAACAAAGVFFAANGNVLTGIAVLGAGLFSVGIAIFAFCGCRAATKGVWTLTGKSAICLKHCFIHREGTK